MIVRWGNMITRLKMSVCKINNLFINAQGLELICFSFSLKLKNQATLAWHIGKKLWLWILQNVSGILRGVFVKLYCLSDFGRSKVKYCLYWLEQNSMNFLYYVILDALCCEATVFLSVAKTISSPTCWVCFAAFTQIPQPLSNKMTWIWCQCSARHNHFCHMCKAKPNGGYDDSTRVCLWAHYVCGHGNCK